MIDYKGKLNNHEDYVNILNKIFKKCKYIEIVFFVSVDLEDENEIVERFKDDIIKHEKVTKWWQTISRKKHHLYRIKATKELFEYLKKYETFCKYHVTKITKEGFIVGVNIEPTDFGFDDIAFYDEFDNYLLYTNEVSI